MLMAVLLVLGNVGISKFLALGIAAPVADLTTIFARTAFLSWMRAKVDEVGFDLLFVFVLPVPLEPLAPFGDRRRRASLASRTVCKASEASVKAAQACSSFAASPWSHMPSAPSP